MRSPTKERAWRYSTRGGSTRRSSSSRKPSRSIHGPRRRTGSCGSPTTERAWPMRRWPPRRRRWQPIPSSPRHTATSASATGGGADSRTPSAPSRRLSRSSPAICSISPTSPRPISVRKSSTRPSTSTARRERPTPAPRSTRSISGTPISRKAWSSRPSPSFSGRSSSSRRTLSRSESSPRPTRASASGERRGGSGLGGPSRPPWLLCVRVEAAAGFAAELAGHHHSLEQRRRRVAGFAEFLEHHFGDVQRSVEADQIEQGERSHRIAAAELHRRVDILERREPALVDADRVEQVGHEETVDDERGRILGLYRRLAHRAHPLGGGLHRVVAAQDRAHDLDELHERDRVAEVQAEDLGRPPARRRHRA